MTKETPSSKPQPKQLDEGLVNFLKVRPKPTPIPKPTPTPKPTSKDKGK